MGPADPGTGERLPLVDILLFSIEFPEPQGDKGVPQPKHVGESRLVGPWGRSQARVCTERLAAAAAATSEAEYSSHWRCACGPEPADPRYRV